MKVKSILIVTSEFPPQPGGIGNHAYNLALQLSRHGYVVTVISDQRTTEDSEEILFDSSLPFSVRRIHITSPRFYMYLQRLVVMFKSLKRSDFIIATGKFSLWSVAFASLFCKRPYFAVIHGTEVNFKSFYLRHSIQLALKRFTSIIAVSHFTKQLIAPLQLPITVIPNGYNHEKWFTSPPVAVPIKGFPKLITVGNVTSRKGQQNVISMLPCLIARYPDVHYHCVGLKTEADSFLELANDLNVADYVTFHGRVTDVQLKGMLADADLFVMLSTETETGDVEGFGIAILEANSLGVPAIGAKGCGIEDAINDGRSGVLIHGSNTQAFLEAIQFILGRQDAFKVGALEWASMHHWEVIAKEYIKVLDMQGDL